MKLALLHPTRGRPELFGQVLNLWIERFQSNIPFPDYWIALDSQDSRTYEPVYEAVQNKPASMHLETMVGPRIDFKDETGINLPDFEQRLQYLTSINKVNRLAKKAIDAGADWLFFIADDYHPPVGWDRDLKDLLSKFDPNGLHVLSMAEDNRKLITHPIISRGFYQKEGFFCHPKYLHVCADVDLWWVAYMEDAIRPVPAEVSKRFEHHNPYVKANVGWDAVYTVGNHRFIYMDGNMVWERRREELQKKYKRIVGV